MSDSVYVCFLLELDRLHNYSTVRMPIVRTADGEADCDCYRLSLKCLIYRRGGKQGQFIKVNYHIQTRHRILIIGQQGNRTTAWFYQRQIFFFSSACHSESTSEYLAFCERRFTNSHIT